MVLGLFVLFLCYVFCVFRVQYVVCANSSLMRIHENSVCMYKYSLLRERNAFDVRLGMAYCLCSVWFECKVAQTQKQMELGNAGRQVSPLQSTDLRYCWCVWLSYNVVCICIYIYMYSIMYTLVKMHHSHAKPKRNSCCCADLIATTTTKRILCRYNMCDFIGMRIIMCV